MANCTKLFSSAIVIVCTALSRICCNKTSIWLIHVKKSCAIKSIMARFLWKHTSIADRYHYSYLIVQFHCYIFVVAHLIFILVDIQEFKIFLLKWNDPEHITYQLKRRVIKYLPIIKLYHINVWKYFPQGRNVRPCSRLKTSK